MSASVRSRVDNDFELGVIKNFVVYGGHRGSFGRTSTGLPNDHQYDRRDVAAVTALLRYICVPVAQLFKFRFEPAWRRASRRSLCDFFPHVDDRLDPLKRFYNSRLRYKQVSLLEDLLLTIPTYISCYCISIAKKREGKDCYFKKVGGTDTDMRDVRSERRGFYLTL